jgi:polyhydroxyalkanoate synthesis regulator phasin
MITETEAQAQPAETEAVEAGSALAGALNKLLLASIGAVSLAEETAENVLHRLVERGEIDMRNARRSLNELRARRPHLPRPPRPVIAIGTEHLASKRDIEALQKQVTELSAEVEQLNRRTT